MYWDFHEAPIKPVFMLQWNSMRYMWSYVVRVVSKLPLGAQCQSGDVCLDTASSCRDSICQCNPHYYPRAGRCGQSFHVCSLAFHLSQSDSVYFCAFYWKFWSRFFKRQIVTCNMFALWLYSELLCTPVVQAVVYRAPYSIVGLLTYLLT